MSGGCRGRVRAYPDRRLWSDEAGPSGALRAGVRIRGRAVWRRLPPREWTTPERSGYLILESAERAPERLFRGRMLRARGRVQERLVDLFGELAPVTEALVLARKERLDPEVRDAFARAGIAHLLAISGFHVGIVAGLVLTLARLAGAGPRRAPGLAAAAAGAYVVGIGAPDAAVRAAILLGLLAVGRLRARPLAPLGALATALLGFLLVDPGAAVRAGFQLSFAGVGGLILWSRPWGREIRALCRGRVPAALADALGAALAATAATLPLVAWHFGRVPLFGVPATLVLGPAVALSIPGVFACLLLDPLLPGAAEFLSGGVEALLEIAVRGARWTAGIPGSAPWVPPSALGVAAVAGAGCWLLLRMRGGLGRGARRATLGCSLAAGLLVAPVAVRLVAGGTVEIVAIDVGQGDALAIRSPAGRWVLVDAGPRSEEFDAGARRVLPYLGRRGVRRLEALVLTHPDLDHVGGAPAVLNGLEVGGVMDPGRAAPTTPFRDVLAAARDRGVGWWPAGARRTLELDGIELRVLYPPDPRRGSVEADRESRLGPGRSAVGFGTDANDLSVVLLLRYGRFGALLTGDAPSAVEEAVLHRIEGPVQVLKVGHHGSATSTSRTVVETLRPEVAVVPVGWRNRYGHPHPTVLERLVAAGVRVYRTDLHGTVSIRATRDGRWSVTLPDR